MSITAYVVVIDDVNDIRPSYAFLDCWSCEWDASDEHLDATMHHTYHEATSSLKEVETTDWFRSYGQKTARIERWDITATKL